MNHITPANVGIGNTFTVTINGKNVTFTATAATVQNVVEGLQALLAASTIPEFQEVTWTEDDLKVIGTAATPGKPFTQTSSASGGTATLTTTTPTASSGPNHYDAVANWSPVNVPVSGDDLFFEDSAVDVLYGIDQSAVRPASVNVRASYTGKIGLPVFTGAYFEYRPTYLRFNGGGGTVAVNVGHGPGQGSSRVKIDTGADQTTFDVVRTAAPESPGIEAALLKGTHASNVANITRGSVGFAVFAGETATIATLRCGFVESVQGDATVRCGSGVTLTTIEQSGGVLTINSNATTITKTDGTLFVEGAAAVTTLHNRKGNAFYKSTGTLSTVNVGSEAVLDFRQDMRARTVTTTNVHGGGAIFDPHKTVARPWTIAIVEAELKEVTLDLGTNLSMAVT